MSEPLITFFVPGIAKPGGSKRAFWRPGMKHAAIVDASDNKSWRNSIAWTAKKEWGDRPLLSEPLSVRFYFTMSRPKNHFRTGKHSKELRPDAGFWVAKKPDTTKLIRAAEDALTGVLWTDDAIICEQSAQKVFGDHPGVTITVSKL